MKRIVARQILFMHTQGPVQSSQDKQARSYVLKALQAMPIAKQAHKTQYAFMF